MNADGNRVNLGNFDSLGLNVNNYFDDNRNDNLGLAVAREYNSLVLINTPTREYLLKRL